MLLFTDSLRIFVLMLLATYATADTTFVVFAPKVLRPGFDAKIQYNTRMATDYDTVTTEISQRGIVKGFSKHQFVGGKLKL